VSTISDKSVAIDNRGPTNNEYKKY